MPEQGTPLVGCKRGRERPPKLDIHAGSQRPTTGGGKEAAGKVKSEAIPKQEKAKEVVNPKQEKVSGDNNAKKPKRNFLQRRVADRVYASDEARQYAEDMAKEVQSRLDPEFPSFIKPMTQSHISGGFWLSLPRNFAVKHLPKKDAAVTLIDESMDASPTLYLANKNGLSGGWRGFSIKHNLADGDALVFQLVNLTTFKVYILRASDYFSGDASRRNQKNSSVQQGSNQKNSPSDPNLKNSVPDPNLKNCNVPGPNQKENRVPGQYQKNSVPVPKKSSVPVPNKESNVPVPNKESGVPHPKTSNQKESGCQGEVVKNVNQPRRSIRLSQRGHIANTKRDTVTMSFSSESVMESEDEEEDDDDDDSEAVDSLLDDSETEDDSLLSSSQTEGTNTDNNEDAMCNDGEDAVCCGSMQRERDGRNAAGKCCFQCFTLKQGLKRKAAETETAIKENIELRYFKTCKVCMELDMSILLLPCKHLCLCRECDPKLHLCPICTTPKVSSVEVYMS